MRRLLIFGIGGQGKVVAETAESLGFGDLLFFADNSSGLSCLGHSVIGNSEDFFNWEPSEVFVAFGNQLARKAFIERIKRDARHHLVTLIHPSAFLSHYSSVGEGSILSAGSIVMPNTRIGSGCIINTASSVDHDCVVGDFVHVSVGAHVAGCSSIGEGTWLGAGSIVNDHISICSWCMIGSGALVVKNIDETGTYIGVPARKMWKRQENGDEQGIMPSVKKAESADELRSAVASLECTLRPNLSSCGVNIDAYASELFEKGLSFIAWSGCKPVGLISGYANDASNHTGYISFLAVDSKLRRRGIGQMLIRRYEVEAAKLGMTSLAFEVHKNNNTAISFYYHVGAYIEKEKDKDSWIMRKTLVSSVHNTVGGGYDEITFLQVA